MSALRRTGLEAMGRVLGRLARSHRGQTVLFNAIRLDRRPARRLRDDPEVRFLSYVLAHRERSRSQILQDLWVCFELQDKRDGFFVEFGATDGRTNSNTWLLEKEFGWRGLLVEPNPYWHAALARARSVPIDHRCVASTSGAHVEFVATDDSDPELSGIAAFSQGAHFESARRAGKRIAVETVSLDDLLSAYDAPARIDYLSIDTEGNELDVLRHFDLDRHRPSLLSVEHNAETEQQIQSLLQAQGYRRVFGHLSQWDSWYVAEELRSTAEPSIYVPAG